MGGHLGDPYTIGGKRGMIPPASLSRVYSPPPPSRGGAHGAWALGQPPKEFLNSEFRGRSWVHKPTGSQLAPMAPPLLGGGSFYSKFASIS